jgi:hypothetical protein
MLIWEYSARLGSAWKGYENIAKPLLVCGADIDSQDKLGQRPLNKAIEKRHETAAPGVTFQGG